MVAIIAGTANFDGGELVFYSRYRREGDDTRSSEIILIGS